MQAHQRESSSCTPQPMKNAPKAVKDAEKALAFVIEEGNRLQSQGSYEQVQQNIEDRKLAEQAERKNRLAAARPSKARRLKWEGIADPLQSLTIA